MCILLIFRNFVNIIKVDGQSSMSVESILTIQYFMNLDVFIVFIEMG